MPSDQCFILFGLGQEFSFRCLLTLKSALGPLGSLPRPSSGLLLRVNAIDTLISTLPRVDHLT